MNTDVRGSLTITPAAGGSLGEVNEQEVLYLQDLESRCYLEQRQNKVRTWSDGQEFIGLYRRLEVASTFALFDPASTELRSATAATSFDRAMPYANYNWELFLHAPLTMAAYLASQHRFADARRWLHAVFDPTTEQTTAGVSQFWRFMPFVNGTRPDAVAKLLTLLADPSAGDSDVEAISRQIDEWKKNPFMPHLIARLRPSAYQWYTFFAYVDLLIGWGDQLFRRDTRESVNDATLLYVLAAKLLGPRPCSISSDTPAQPQTYRSLPYRSPRANKRGKPVKLDEFGEAWVAWSDLHGVINRLAKW